MTKKVQLLTADSKQEVLHPETTADMVLVAVDQNLMEKLATLLPLAGGIITGNLEVTGTVQVQGRLITNEAFYVTNGTDGAFAAKLGGNGVDLGDTTKSTAICSSETPKYWDGTSRHNIHNDKDNPIDINPTGDSLVRRNADGDVLAKKLLIDDGEIWNGVARTLGIGIAHYSGSNDGYLRKLANGEMDIGHTNYKYRNVYATVGNINTSDVQLKENIEPVLSGDTTRMANEEAESQTHSSPTVEDYYNFVKELPLYTYDYKSEGEYNRALHNVGFIAQDIADTAVGHEFVFKGEDGIYQYNMQGYVGVLAVALQNAIKEIEFLKEQQENKSRYVN